VVGAIGFAKLLGAKALFGYVITLPVSEIVKFLRNNDGSPVGKARREAFLKRSTRQLRKFLIFAGEPLFTVILENRELFGLTSLKADFVPAHPFFNLLCPFRGG
jgi:hypothetical protein